MTFVVASVLGFLGAIPVAGPVSALILARALKDKHPSRFHHARMLAIGAAIAEGIYAGIAFLGFSALVSLYPFLDSLLRGLTALILLGLGIYFVWIPVTQDQPPTNHTKKFKNSFLLGFSISILNPTLLVTWSTAIAALHTYAIVPTTPHHALPFSLGIAVGIAAWFFLLLALIKKYHTHFNPRAIQWGLKGVGIILIALGLHALVKFF